MTSVTNKIPNPTVEIEQGELKGMLSKTLDDKEYYTFKGIPYAKPPVGDLRFCVPEPPESWGGIWDATKNCNFCAQYDRASGNFAGDEDCLYLNVYTPRLPADDSSSLPVMFYIHGGGFLFSNGTDETSAGPDFLIKKDVVIVTFNYRLGILGFLSLDRKEAPGNMGLRDQVQALKWVQKNISKFGGDPNNVTIFGVSAGAASVEYLLLSPMAKGLFHKAIAQGGSSLSHWAHNTKVKQLAATIPILNGKSVSDDEEVFKYLKELSVKDLVLSSMAALAADKFRGSLHFGFVPTIEKPGDWEPFLDKSTYDLMLRGEFTKVPFISGFCTREGLIMLPMGTSTLGNLVKERNFVQHLPYDFELGDAAIAKFEMKFKTTYFEGENKYNDSDNYAIDFFTDVFILGGSYTAASLMAKHNPSVYLYEFSYDGYLNYVKKILNIKRKGASHADDAGYVLKNCALTDDPSTTDKLVINRIVEMWTNLATYGEPTPKKDDLITTKWEPIAKNKSPCLVIDNSLIVKNGLYPKRMKLFEELYAKYYKP